MRYFDNKSQATHYFTGIEVISIVASLITIISGIWGTYKLVCRNCDYSWKEDMKRDAWAAVTCPHCGKQAPVNT